MRMGECSQSLFAACACAMILTLSWSWATVRLHLLLRRRPEGDRFRLLGNQHKVACAWSSKEEVRQLWHALCVCVCGGNPLFVPHARTPPL